MTIDMRRFRETFFEEAAEHTATIESGLLSLIESGADPERLNTIFRSAHSIKGSSGSFGFEAIAHFTHTFESVLDRMRGGALAPQVEWIGVLLRANDVLKELLAATRLGRASSVPTDAVHAELERALGSSAPATPGVLARGAAGASAEAAEALSIRFEPKRDFFRQGQDPFVLLREVANVGELLHVTCDVSRLPALDALDPEECHLAWSLRVRGAPSVQALRETFMFVEDECRLEIRSDGSPDAGSGEAAGPGPERRAGADRRKHHRGEPASTIRVPTEKVDALINLVGELVIAQAMVNQAADPVIAGGQTKLAEALTVVQRSTRELQEQVMAIRMLAVGTVFHRFPRLVHDLASRLGKRVRLELAGAETELDKAVIEGLGDPLTHLIRNAVDHGIEPPHVRAAAGKPEEGLVSLRAFHEGGNVVIEVRDDGGGLDRERVVDVAVAQGLMRAHDVMSDEALMGLVFRPGFSTAVAVSDVSGRGVGMDVVKRNVESLNGSIALSSEKGLGTRVRIRLPLTLAILDGLLVGVGGQTYIVPLLSIRQSVRPSRQDLKTLLGGRGEWFLLRGEPLPLVRAADLFHLQGAVTDPCDGIVIVAEHDGARFALLVDDIVGQAQVVIKNIENNFRKVEAVMGATILGDGRVALIVDVPELHRAATRPTVAAREHPAADVPLARAA